MPRSCLRGRSNPGTDVAKPKRRRACRVDRCWSPLWLRCGPSAPKHADAIARVVRQAARRAGEGGNELVAGREFEPAAADDDRAGVDAAGPEDGPEDGGAPDRANPHAWTQLRTCMDAAVVRMRAILDGTHAENQRVGSTRAQQHLTCAHSRAEFKARRADSGHESIAVLSLVNCRACTRPGCGGTASTRPPRPPHFSRDSPRADSVHGIRRRPCLRRPCIQPLFRATKQPRGRPRSRARTHSR